MTFATLGIHQCFETALSRQGITEPTAVQIESIPVLAEGKDAYIHSETGSGKTLAYLLPLMSRVDLKSECTQLAVVAPTHELAIQIQRQACDLAQNGGLPIRTLLLIGGTAMDRQVEKLKKKPHIVVGSPGRICELMEMKKLKGNTLRAIVLDEADRLLGDASFSSVRKIVSLSPPGRQVVFISATAPEKALKEAASMARDIVLVQTNPAPLNANITHQFVVCEERDKPDVLRKLIHATGAKRALVFVHRNHSAETVAAKLAHHKIATVDLHGAHGKDGRKEALDGFKRGETRVLIASDIAARGLDIHGISHVFNVDAPSQSSDYVHRAGRTARAGASGFAVSLLTADEMRLVKRYESELGIQLQAMRLREGRLVPSSQLSPLDHGRTQGGGSPKS